MLLFYRDLFAQGRLFDFQRDTSILTSINGTDNLIKVLAKAGNYLYFDVCPELTSDNQLQRDPETLETLYSDDFGSGNSLLAVKNGGNLAWSWHLWFSPHYTVLGYDIGEVTYQDMPDSKPQMMDRNLGADVSGLSSVVPGSVSGLYYKYGYRSPFYNGSYYGIATDADGLTWVSDTDNKKHKMDPCPPGYRVPESSEWTSRGSHSLVTSSYQYYDEVLYPYSEYLLADGTPNENDPEYLDFIDEYKFSSTGSENGTIKLEVKYNSSWFGEINLGSYDVPILAVDEFTLTDLEILTSVQEGRLWSNSGYFYYKRNHLNVREVFQDGIEALRDKLKINAYTQTRKVATSYRTPTNRDEAIKFFSDLGSAIAKGNIEEFLEPIANWSSPAPVNPPHMTDNDVDFLLGKLILLDSENIDVPESDTKESINVTEGYQVRCMKE